MNFQRGLLACCSERLVDPVLALLKRGISPSKLALSLVLGFVLGVFPVVGSTSVLCGVAAFALRLNLPAIQLVNYLVYPLQLLLFIPFMRLGEWLLGVGQLPLSVAEIATLVEAQGFAAFDQLWRAAMHAIVAWFMIAPMLGALLYVILRLMFCRLAGLKSA